MQLLYEGIVAFSVSFVLYLLLWVDNIPSNLSFQVMCEDCCMCITPASFFCRKATEGRACCIQWFSASMDQHTFDLTIREDPSKVIPTLGRKAQTAVLARGASVWTRICLWVRMHACILEQGWQDLKGLQLNFLNGREMKRKVTVQITHSQTYSRIGKSPQTPRHYSVTFSILHGYKMTCVLSQFASTPQQIDQHISTYILLWLIYTMSLVAGYPKHLAECHHGSLAIPSPRHTLGIFDAQPEDWNEKWHPWKLACNTKIIVWIWIYPPTQYLSPPGLLHV